MPLKRISPVRHTGFFRNYPITNYPGTVPEDTNEPRLFTG